MKSLGLLFATTCLVLLFARGGDAKKINFSDGTWKGILDCPSNADDRTIINEFMAKNPQSPNELRNLLKVNRYKKMITLRVPNRELSYEGSITVYCRRN